MVRPGRPHRSSAAAAARPSPYALPNPSSRTRARRSATPAAAADAKRRRHHRHHHRHHRHHRRLQEEEEQEEDAEAAAAAAAACGGPRGFQLQAAQRRSIEIEPLKAEAEACDRYLEDLDVYHQVFGEYPSSDEHPLPSCVVRYCDRLMALPVAERASAVPYRRRLHPGFAIARLMVMDRCKAEFTESDAASRAAAPAEHGGRGRCGAAGRGVGPNGETTLTHDRTPKSTRAPAGPDPQGVVWVKSNGRAPHPMRQRACVCVRVCVDVA